MANVKNEKKAKKEKKPTNQILILIFVILSVIASAFAIYNIYLLDSIENLIRYIVMILMIVVDLFLIIKTVLIFKNKKKTRHRVLLTFMIFYIIASVAVGGAIFYGYGLISSVNKKMVTYSSSLVTKSTNEAKDAKDLKDATIGMIKDKTSPEGYIIPMEMIEENKLQDENDIKKYEDYSAMIYDLYNGEIDAMFVSSDYVSMYSGIAEFANISTETKVIATKEKEMAKKSEADTKSTGKNLNEPFTILLMGIDSIEEGLKKNAVANGDSLILVTFNPKTLSATMLSIPRDSYVPIACFNDKAENKITHAAWYGTDCMMKTIENYFDITIDYYAKINFKGLVHLVDAVGGIDAEVPADLCTDDSNRWKQVCIKEGFQHLNGEQALVLSRNRKQLKAGDLDRGQNQQLVIQALINKMKNISDVNKFMDILNTISNNLDTNFTTSQILSFYNIGKDILKKSLAKDEADLISIQQLYLQGTGQMIYDERMRMVLWDYVPDTNSRDDIVEAMNINLGKEKHKTIKKFNFSINEPYEKEVIGYGPYKTAFTYDLVPNFVGYSESTARSIASRYGVSVSFRGSGGYVVSQSAPANKRVDKFSGTVTLTLSGGSSSSSNNNSDNKKTPEKVIPPVDPPKEVQECPEGQVKDDTGQCVDKEPVIGNDE